MVIPSRNAERVALAGTVVSAVFGALLFVVATLGNSMAARAEGAHLLIGVLVWGITFLHLRARRLAVEERVAIEEAERVRAGVTQARLFEGDALSGALAQARLAEMEKYGVSITSVLVIGAQLLVAALFLYALAFWTTAPGIAAMLGANPAEGLSRAVLCGFLAAGTGFFAFALGTYASGMAQDPKYRLLRAGAGYLLGNALCLALLAAAFGLGYLQWTTGERILCWIIPAGLGVLGIEMLVNFVLDFYRPRTAGVEMRPVYDSRLTGLMAEPQGLFHTFAQTMDYQFGFNVSETWFFRFLEKAIAPLLVFQFLVFYLLTCVVVVQPGTVVVIERWGRPIGVDSLPALADDAAWDRLAAPVEPGLCLKWPWPIETARRVNRDMVQDIYLGSPQKAQAEIRAEARRDSMDPNRQLVSWDVEHIKDEFKYIMPVDASREAGNIGSAGTADAEKGAPKTPDCMFVSGRVQVQYVVGRGEPGSARRSGDVYRYLYRHGDPKALMITLAEHEVTGFLAGSDFWHLIIDGTKAVEKELHARIQKAADEAGLGVRIVFVGVADMHPPVGEVGKSYQEVVAADEERQAAINTARGEERKILGRVSGSAHTLQQDATAFAAQRKLVSAAEAERFSQQLGAYNAAPEAFREREILSAMESGLAKTRLVIRPQGIVTVIDDKQDLTAASIGKTLAEEAAKQ